MKYIAAFWLVGLVGLSYMAIQEVKATYDSTIVITPRNYDYKSSVDGVEIGDLPVVSLKPKSSKTTTTPTSSGSSATSSSSGTKSVTRSNSSTVRVKEKKGWGFSEALGGIILIWLAIPMVWMNERKDVKMYNVIVKGREAVVKIDCDAPEEGNEYALVHVQGETSTE